MTTTQLSPASLGSVRPPTQTLATRAQAIQTGSPKGLPWLIVLAVALFEVMALAGVNIPVVTAVAGLWLLIGLPAQLLFAKVNWKTTTATIAACYSISAVIIAIMAVGLLANTVLPWGGVDRPLARFPVAVFSTCCLGALLYWRPERWRLRDGLHESAVLNGRDITVLGLGLTTVFMAVTGAIRLNNDHNGAVTLVMLCVISVLMLTLVAWRRDLNAGTVNFAIYMISLSLLLMTSMRGWWSTGHDIQNELDVFQLTNLHERWNIAFLHDPYNACISITILPTIISKLTHLSDPYVYKLPFQMLFALSPVIAYQLARRFGSLQVALLSSILFFSFPTFAIDMPYMNRQEIAFLFFGVTVLVATEPNWSVFRRRAWFTAFGLGILLAHYSTNYVFIAGLLVVWLGRFFVGLVAGRRRAYGLRWFRDEAGTPIAIFNIVLLAAVAWMWSGPLTHTNGQLEKTFHATLSTLSGQSQGERSSETSYSFLSGSHPDPAERLSDYEGDQRLSTPTPEQRAAATLYPLDQARQYSTPIADPEKRPLLGSHDSVSSQTPVSSGIGDTFRVGIAQLVQLLVAVGLLVVAFSVPKHLRVSKTYLLFSLAALCIVASQVVVPQLSVDYGVLRAFQQALFVLGPYVAIGLIAVLTKLRIRRFMGVASVLAVVMFMTFNGVVPQLVSGFPVPLHLNNAGEYYNIYYVQPEEVSAGRWLHGQVEAHDLVPSEAVQADNFTFQRTQAFVDLPAADDIYPTLVRANSYVFLGAANVQRHISTVFFQGDLLTYSYPITFLDDNKNLIYSSGGARIYR